MKEKLAQGLRGQKLGRRSVVYVLGYFIMTLGVAVSINADLGVTPVTSLPYVISLILDRYPGMVVTITFCVLILFQVLLLRRKFKPISLTQIVPAALFGSFVDLTIWLIGDFAIPTYAGRLVMLAISIVFVALGIILAFDANFANLPAVSLTVAITQVAPNHKIFGKFHIVKVLVDSAIVSMGIALSLIFLGGLSGIREGTILTALLVGRIIPYLRKVTDPVMRKIGVI